MGGVGGSEKSYLTGDTPWDTGIPTVELIRILEAGWLPDTTLLEFSCGTGTKAIEFARRGYEVTAIDFAGTAIQRAREKGRRAEFRFTLSPAGLPPARVVDSDGTPLRLYNGTNISHQSNPSGANSGAARPPAPPGRERRGLLGKIDTPWEVRDELGLTCPPRDPLGCHLGFIEESGCPSMRGEHSSSFPFPRLDSASEALLVPLVEDLDGQASGQVCEVGILPAD